MVLILPAERWVSTRPESEVVYLGLLGGTPGQDFNPSTSAYVVPGQEEVIRAQVAEWKKNNPNVQAIFPINETIADSKPAHTVNPLKGMPESLKTIGLRHEKFQARLLKIASIIEELNREMPLQEAHIVNNYEGSDAKANLDLILAGLKSPNLPRPEMIKEIIIQLEDIKKQL
jgi:hypothetical protein